MEFRVENERSADRLCADVERILEEANVLYEENDRKFLCNIPDLLSFEVRVEEERFFIKSMVHHRIFFYALVDEFVRVLQLVRD